MNCDRCKSTAVALFGGVKLQQGAAWCWGCCQLVGIASAFSRLRTTATASVDPLWAEYREQRKAEKRAKFEAFLKSKGKITA